MNRLYLFLTAIALIISVSVSVPAVSQAQETGQGVGLKIQSVHQLPKNSPTPGTATVTFRITSGSHAGDTVLYTQHLWGNPQYDPKFEVGKRFTAQLQVDSQGHIQQILLHHDRKDYKLLLMFAIVSISLFVIGRWEGLVGLISTVVTMLLIYYAFFSFISRANLILPLGIMICLITIVLTVSLVMKWKQPTWPAIISLSLVFGIILTLSILGMKYLHLDARKARHSRLILSWIDHPENLWKLLVIGIVLGTLGALMDVAVVISSTIHEIVRDSEDIRLIKAYRSGLRVGREILSTMLNTLIFAYLSILFPILLSFRIFDLSYLRFINYDFVGIEILRIAVGLIGLSLIIPATALLSAWWCCRE